MPALQKKLLREVMKEKRALLFQQHADAGEQIVPLFFEAFDFLTHFIVGAYWPMGSEFDVRPLLNELINKGFRCALPCITPEGMIFRLWSSTDVLHPGKFNIFEPSNEASQVVPDVLLVPLLAFDKEGHRLGYGQGHYDKFLHTHKVITIGIGFKDQEIERVPRQAHDFALDFILTEEGVFTPLVIPAKAH